MLRDRKNYPGYFTQHQQLLIKQLTADHFANPESLSFCTGLSQRQVVNRLKELEHIGLVYKVNMMQIFKSRLYVNSNKMFTSAMLHIMHKRSLLQNKLSKYFHVAIYNRQFFYALTAYGMQQQEMISGKTKWQDY